MKEECTEIKQLLLEKIRIKTVQSFSKELPLDISVDVLYDYALEQFRVYIKGHYWGTKKQVHRNIEYPASLWDCVKKYLGKSYKTTKVATEITYTIVAPGLRFSGREGTNEFMLYAQQMMEELPHE